jgi:hypothetical protein
VELEFLWKTITSQTGECPSLYRAERDGVPGYVTQGKVLAPDEVAQLRDLGRDENAVWVDAEVLDRLVDERLAARGLA